MVEIVKNELHMDVDESEIRRIFDTYETSEDDPNFMLNNYDGLGAFIADWAHDGFIFDGEFNFPTSDITASAEAWPQGGEIAEAISGNSQSGFTKNGRLITCEELVAKLYDQDISLITGGRYPADYEWQSDMHFVIRYVVSAFVGKWDDFNADSLTRIIEFVGVGPVDQDIV